MSESQMLLLASEKPLEKDWLGKDEDEAWKNLCKVIDGSTEVKPGFFS